MLTCASAMAARVFELNGIPWSSLWFSYGNIVVNGVPVPADVVANLTNQAQTANFITLVLMVSAN